MLIPYDVTLKQIALKFGREMHKESRYSHYDFSEEKILNLLNHPNTYCVFSKTNDVITGFFIGFIQELWFSKTKVGIDLALYILPEFRARTLCAIRLIKDFEKHCSEKGCKEINLSSSAEISENSALNLYNKMGYDKCGFITFKAI
jgi:ribosomal protein S18 acetylase RimI-like enzyme